MERGSLESAASPMVMKQPEVMLPRQRARSSAPTVALATEPALMQTLRALGDSDPQRSLQLASEAERRFPDSPDAPERAWYVCKSLVNLERFSDARHEAKLMVEKYAGTSWASDVARHLLVNPPGMPGDPIAEQLESAVSP